MTITMPPKPAFTRGDVVLALFPNSNLVSAKTRPALVVQRNNLQSGLSQIILAMITSQIVRGGHPSRVMALLSSPEGRRSGLLTDSVVMTDNLATVMESAISSVIGSLPMGAVDKALRHSLDL